MTVKELHELLLAQANGHDDAVVCFHTHDGFLKDDGAWCILTDSIVILELIRG